MNLKIGELIRERLKAKNINQVQLADMVDLTPPQISRIISGERGTSLENLIAIADALQIERGHFLFRGIVDEPFMTAVSYFPQLS